MSISGAGRYAIKLCARRLKALVSVGVTDSLPGAKPNAARAALTPKIRTLDAQLSKISAARPSTTLHCSLSATDQISRAGGPMVPLLSLLAFAKRLQK